MNAVERMVATVGFEETDRAPLMPQIFAHAASIKGKTVGEYIRSGETIASCQLASMERYGYDVAFALADVNVETEALGSVLDYVEDDYATIRDYAIKGEVDLDALRLPNPSRAGRMPEILKAAKILRGEVGDEAMIIGCVLGPLSLAVQLLGIEKALFLAMDEPEVFEKLLDFTADCAITFGRAQIEAGAHLPVVFDPASSPAVIPAQFFREFELPRLKRIYDAFRDAGASINWLHIAGPAAPILPFYPEAGVNLANFDYYISAEEIDEILPKTAVNGNITSMDFEGAKPEHIHDQAAHLMDVLGSRGGFVLSSGCEIPPKSRVENIEAFIAAGNR